MSETHQREAALFDAALELPPDQRAAHLDQACGGDAELRRRVEALLKACECRSEFLDAPGDPALPPTLHVAVPLTEKPGDRIGRYKLLERIGEGGCGVVYVAEQAEPVRRRVALKIIKLGMDTRSVIARFEAERQALALMDHPSIAKVFDAGATETGRPYFVMELVRGRTLTEYCDEKNLAPRDRLQLFIQVCQAIQHAHQKGIIHRDIKPSNVLVTVNDGVAVPKVIDFGVAKATGGQLLTDKTIYTAFEQFIGTPAYMSPEQAILTSVDIDTRSDIYALGVLLYELLTGRTPFDARELLAAGLDEMRRTIRDREPPRPSARLSTLPGLELNTAAKRRSLDAPRLLSELRGDLDWIVMKALEKDRARRYETANGLAADVQRHLNNEPVVACPPSRLYRLQKMVRRNRLAFAAGATVTASLAVGLILSMVLLARERAARQRADRQEAKAREQTAVAQAVSDFVQEDLLRQAGSVSQADAGFTPDPNLTVRAAVERAAERLGTRFQDHPLQEAGVRHVIGLALGSIGESERAIPHAQKAWDLRREKLGPDDRLTLQSMGLVGKAKVSASRPDLALPILEELRRRSQAALGADDPDTLNAMELLAGAYFALRRIELEVPLREEVFRRREATLGRDHRDTLLSMRDLAWVYARDGKIEQALSLAEEAFKRSGAALSADHPTTLDCRMTWANCFLRAGKFPEATSLHRENLQRYQAVLGEDHPSTFWAMHNLTVAYLRSGQPDLALPLAEETLKRRRAKLGPDHRDTMESLTGLADALQSAGRFDEVPPVLEERLRLTRARLGADHRDSLWALSQLAAFYTLTDQFDKAVPLLEDCWRRRKATLGPDHRDSLSSQASLGANYTYAGQFDKARPLLEEAVELMKLHLGLNDRQTLGTMNNLALLYERSGKLEQARELYEETLKSMRGALPPDDEFLLIATKNLAKAYRAAGQLDQALPLYEDRWARLKAKHGPDAAETMDAMNDLRSAYQTAGKNALSLPLAQATVTYRREKLGPHHRETLGAMCNLAIDYRETGNFDQALPLFEQTIALMKLKLKPEDSYLGITMNNLATAYERAGKPGEAVRQCEELLSLQKAAPGPEHPDTLRTMSRLALMYRSAGRFDQALPRQEEATRLFQATLGPDHPETLHAMHGSAEILGGMKQYDKALNLLRTAAAKGSVEAMNTLAWRLATLSDDTHRNGREAVDLAQQALAKAQGNPWSALDTLAAAQAEAGEFAKAADSQRQAIGACQDEEIKTHLTARLKLYESGTPFREPW